MEAILFLTMLFFVTEDRSVISDYCPQSGLNSSKWFLWSINSD